MSSVNKVILVGRLGADPELRRSNGTNAACQLSVATNRRWTDASGQKQEEVSWHRIVVWGKQGEVCQQFLSKGRQVYVEGRLRSYSYVDNNGTKRFGTEVVSDNIVFLSGGSQHAAPRGWGGDEQIADGHGPQHTENTSLA